MKKDILMASILASTLMISCSNNELTEIASDESITAEESIPTLLQAGVNANEGNTRVGFDKSGAFYWSKGDRIGLFTEGKLVSTTDKNGHTVEELKHTCAPYLVTEGVGLNKGTFKLDRKEGVAWEGGASLNYVIYPHNFKYSLTTLKNGSLRMDYNFPSSYDYKGKIDSDFFFTEKQGSGNSFNAPMWGKVKGNKVRLQHLGGVFCIKIDKMPIDEGTLVFRAFGKKINGEYPARLFDAGDPEYTPQIKVKTADQGSKGQDVVSIKFKCPGITGKSGVFYVPVPTGTYAAKQGKTTIRVKIDNLGTPGVPGNDNVDGAPLTVYDYKVAGATYDITRGSLQAIYATNQQK